MAAHYEQYAAERKWKGLVLERMQFPVLQPTLFNMQLRGNGKDGTGSKTLPLDLFCIVYVTILRKQMYCSKAGLSHMDGDALTRPVELTVAMDNR